MPHLTIHPSILEVDQHLITCQKYNNSKFLILGKNIVIVAGKKK
jgi:hypothetical protein